MHYPFRLTMLLILAIIHQHISAQNLSSDCNHCHGLTLQVDTSDGQHAIEWSTDREVNIRYFIVEKSLDDITFHTLATVLPTNNYSLPAHYRINDSELIDSSWSIMYYRINAIDMNGKKYMSELYAVTGKSIAEPPSIPINPDGILSQKVPF